MTVRLASCAVALTLGAMAASCAPATHALAATPAPEPRPTQPVADMAQPVGLAALAGRQWVLREWRAGEAFVGTPVVTLSFAEGRATGRSGCNRYTASAKAGAAAGALAFGPIAGTRMACPPAIMTTESRFLAALGHVDRWELVPRGDLALSYKDREGAETVLLFSEVTARRSD